MPKHEMVVGNDGSLRMIYADEAAKIFEGVVSAVTVRRASHVEPEEVVVFDSLPGNDTGVRWQADMGPVGGPVLGPFKTRQEALDAEHAWLIEHDIPFPKEA